MQIGKIIEKVLREKRMPVKELAQKINTNRNNIYDIFRRDAIDTGLLVKIGKALEHDFFQYYRISDSVLPNVEDGGVDFIGPEEIPLLCKRISLLENEITMLKERLRDKELIIELLGGKQTKAKEYPKSKRIKGSN